jgi:hypothetical protein
MTIFKQNSSKETRQEKTTSSQQPRLFDPKLISQCLFKIIPKDYPQTRITDGVFTVDSFWKHGQLKRVDVDQQNITDIVDLLSVETAFEDMLTNAKRFRRNFTGKLKLTVKLKNKEIESLYRDEGNFIINKATHYSHK